MHKLLAASTPRQLELFSRAVITAIDADMPANNFDQELPEEQPHYQRLRQLLRAGDWDVSRMGVELDALSAIVEQWGDDYPADTDSENLSLLVALDAWRNLQSCTEAAQQQACAEQIADQFMDIADSNANDGHSASVELAHWLEHPRIAGAFLRLKNWLEPEQPAR